MARFPLHPSVSVIAEEPEGWKLELFGSRVVRVRVQGASERSVVGGYFAPTFGQRMARPVLTWRHKGPLPLNVETRFEL